VKIITLEIGGFVIIKPVDNFQAYSYPQVYLAKTHQLQYLFQNRSPISDAYNGLGKGGLIEK